MTPGKEKDRVLLAHIRECIDLIRTYTSEGREAFFRSRMAQHAVVYNLQTLAESTQRLSDALKSGKPDVPWKTLPHSATCWSTSILDSITKRYGASLKTGFRSWNRRSNGCLGWSLR